MIGRIEIKRTKATVKNDHIGGSGEARGAELDDSNWLT